MYRRGGSLLLLIVLLFVTSCSIERYQQSGQVLYTGVKALEVQGESSGIEAEEALRLAEEQLSYAPNGALLGSSSVRLPNPLFRPWLFLRFGERKSWLGRVFHRLGAKPIWLSDVNPSLRAKVTERILGEHGYLSARVSPQINFSRDSLQAKVSYLIDLGSPYLLDSVAHLPQWHIAEGDHFAHRQHSPLQRGVRFTHQMLREDRQSTTAYLREHGYYYFTPEYIHYDADTLQRPGYVQLRSHLSEGVSPDVLRQWRIGSVKARFVEANAQGTTLASDTLSVGQGVTAYYEGRIPVRPRVLNRLIRLRPDSLYRASLEERTRKGLMSIGSFASIDLHYTPQEGQDSLPQGVAKMMDMNILLRYDKPWALTIGSRFLHKSTDFWGPGLSLNLTKSNLLGGGETLTLGAILAYEWQVGHTPWGASGKALNSYTLGLEASLTFPTLLLPSLVGHYHSYPTSTSIKLGAQTLKRSGYYTLNSMSLGGSYDWSPREGVTHRWSPLLLNFTSLGYTSSEFAWVLQSNPSLRLSLLDQFIPQMAYAYTRDRRVGTSRRHRLWLRGEVSEAGNLLKGITRLAGKSGSQQQKLLGVPFAQFVKASGELRYTYALSLKQSLVMRLALGAIYSYGNMQRAPYVEQFFVGGANSLRAFTVRSLGPGSFKPQRELNYTFLDRVGESKLEMNLEWRMPLVGNLEGAIFVDAGNVWLLRQDTERPGAALSEVAGLKGFLQQIAVGTGLGLRYDMGYLLIRLDAGLGLHLPYDTGRSSWYNIPRWRDALGIHLAIGYPF